jgi:putative hydrolase of the HAD superfamily
MKRRNDVVVYTDTHPMLGELSTSYKIVAITNGNADVFKTDIGRYFDLAIRADEVGVAKPDRRIFDLTWTRIECTPDQVVHIGDSLENDVQGALNANVLPIWFNPDKGQNKMGVKEISQLADLPAMIRSISGQG